MAHIHPVKDAEAHFVIDPQTREITTEETLEQLIQGDHNSEVYSFEIPKAVDGHPMLSCNKIKVHYINIDSSTKAENKGAYEVTDIKELDEETLVFTWLVSGNATKFQGPLSFLIEFSCLADDGTVDYRWNTGIFSSIPVGQGMSNTDEIVLKYPDILEQWKNEVTGGGGVSSWNDLTDKPFGETTTYGDTLTWDGNTDGLTVTSDVFFLVSENALTMEELANGGSLTIYMDGEIGTEPDISFNEVASGVFVDSADSGALFIVTADNVEFEGMTFEKKGIYFVNDGGVAYPTSLTINNYNGFETTETVPLPNKYLDFIENGKFGDGTLTWDGNAEGLEGIDIMGMGAPSHYRMCGFDGKIVPEEVNYSATLVTADGELTFTQNEMPVEIVGNGIYMFATIYVIVVTKDGVGVDLDGFSFSKDGVYFACVDGSYPTNFTINGCNGFTKERIKEEYLPSTVTTLYLAEDDNYLYIDKETTIKATRDDLLNFIKNGTIVLSFMDVVYWQPVAVGDIKKSSEVSGGTGEHCVVTIVAFTGNTPTKQDFYTSEYTS